MKIQPRALLGSAPLSSSTSSLQRNVRTAFAVKQRIIFNISHSRQLTTRTREMTQRPDSPQLRGTQRQHRPLIVRTLDRTKLTPRDYIDISRIARPRITFAPLSPAPHEDSNLPHVQINAGPLNEGFPPNTAGFLYYHVPPYSPPLAGEVRFRITPSSDPASFAAGSDLLMENGLPWRILLLYMAAKDSFGGLCATLLRDQLVTPQLLDTAASAAAIMPQGDDRLQPGSSWAAIVSSFRRGFHLRLGRAWGGTWTIVGIGKDTVIGNAGNLGQVRVPVKSIKKKKQKAVQCFPFRGIRPRSCCCPVG